MAVSKLSDLLGFILPKKKANPQGAAATGTFNPTQAGQPLSAPAYQDHIADILTNRQQQTSQQLIQDFMKFDPDVSAAVNAYLTVANQKIKAIVYDQNGELDEAGQKQLGQLLQYMTGRNDYSLGFQINQSMYATASDMRYMLMMRGAVGVELVVNKFMLPTEFRLVDPKSLTWTEDSPGQYKPSQAVSGSPDGIDLDIPTFFVAFYRKDPTGIYSYSPFVSVINTVAARQQVINDLYRIMQATGWPRLHIKVMEEVIRKAAPTECALDAVKMREFVNARFQEIKTSVQGLRADEAFVSTDSIESGVLNADAPGVSIDISSIIDVLNGQNQAALKTMATIIGRGESGVNTASVEATIFAMNADSLNEPVAEVLGNLYTMMMRLQGFTGYVDVEFEKVELRPELELEPQRVMKQTRMLELLSYGLIGDNQFHLDMFGRPKPDGIEELSGTGFMNPAPAMDSPSPNSDPMGRALSPEGSKNANSNRSKKGPAKKSAVATTPRKA